MSLSTMSTHLMHMDLLSLTLLPTNITKSERSARIRYVAFGTAVRVCTVGSNDVTVTCVGRPAGREKRENLFFITRLYLYRERNYPPL